MRGTQTPDHYRILGLTSAATTDEVKARYRALSKLHHPDVGGNQAQMAKLNQAYAVLSDAFKRAIYDAEQRRQLEVAASASTQPQTNAVRRPAPRASVKFTVVRRKGREWWAKLAVGFASVVIVAGILLHLPIAEAITLPAPEDSQISKHLDVTYPPESTPSTTTPAAGSTGDRPTQPNEVTPFTEDDSEDTSKHKQKLREFCLLSDNDLTEQARWLCKSIRPTD